MSLTPARSASSSSEFHRAGGPPASRSFPRSTGIPLDPLPEQYLNKSAVVRPRGRAAGFGARNRQAAIGRGGECGNIKSVSHFAVWQSGGGKKGGLDLVREIAMTDCAPTEIAAPVCGACGPVVVLEARSGGRTSCYGLMWRKDKGGQNKDGTSFDFQPDP